MENLELFALDWNRVFEAVGLVILLSFFVERVVALIVETRGFVIRTKVPDPGCEEARREKEAARVARDLLQADTDAAVREVQERLEPDSPLWMPKVVASKQVSERADKYLVWLDLLHERRQRLARLPLKELIAFALAALVCFVWRIDVFSFVLREQQVASIGILLTAALIAGGSKASIKLFHDLLDVRSQAVREMRETSAKG